MGIRIFPMGTKVFIGISIFPMGNNVFTGTPIFSLETKFLGGKYPLFVKPSCGYASKNTKKIRNRQDLIKYMTSFKKNILFENDKIILSELV